MTRPALAALLGLTVLIPITGLAIADTGFYSIIQVLWRDWASTQVFVDLILMCTVVLALMAPDLERRGVPLGVMVLVAAASGSLGILGWFVVRDVIAPLPSEVDQP